MNAHIIRLLSFASLFLATLAAAPAQGQADKPALPKVLILGDSISLGYTPLVKKNLQGVAEVLRPNENCQHTAHGQKRIEAWLGKEKWDVIHFNWGIWDTHLLDAQGKLIRDETGAKGELYQRHTPDQYRQNLTALVERMEKTGAKLIWASTTPVLYRVGPRSEAISELNAVAKKLMDSRSLAIDDLAEFVRPHTKEWQTGDRVHFNAKGNEHLAWQVADSIRQALGLAPAEPPKPAEK
jgi:acyl-CoA thioesterase-1